MRVFTVLFAIKKFHKDTVVQDTWILKARTGVISGSCLELFPVLAISGVSGRVVYAVFVRWLKLSLVE